MVHSVRFSLFSLLFLSASLLPVGNTAMASLAEGFLPERCNAVDLGTLLNSDAEAPKSCGSGPSMFAAQAGVSARSAEAGALTVTASMAGSAGCSATGHDIVVDNIEDLRIALATAAPGSVIGIDGQLDIDSDFGYDVYVFAPGIKLTCASEDAGLTGNPFGALLEVFAEDVTVEHLDFDAQVRRGIRFFAPGGVARENRVNCPQTCIFFSGTPNGLAEGNDIRGGFKSFAIASVGSQNIVVRGNQTSDCWMCVAVIDDHGGAVIESNSAEACEFACIGTDNSAGGRIANNHVRNGAVAIEITSSADWVLAGNDISGCDYPCVLIDYFSGPPSSNVHIIGNTMLDCTKESPLNPAGAVCLYTEDVDGAVIEYNRMSNRPFQPFPEEAPDYVSLPPAAVLLGGSGIQFNDNTTEKGWLLHEEVTDLAIEGNTLQDCLEFLVNYECIAGGAGQGLHIAGNRITATNEEAWGVAIRQFYGSSMEVTNNTVQGSFELGLLTIYILGGHTVAHNEIDILGGFYGYGKGIELEYPESPITVEHNRIRLRDNAPDTVGMRIRGQVAEMTQYVNGEIVLEDSVFNPLRDSLVANNQVKQAGVGMVIEEACSNVFVGNNLKGAETEAVFVLRHIDEYVYEEPENDFYFRAVTIRGGTGDNIVNGGNVITEVATNDLPLEGDGGLDCDDDGFSDPNFYTGPTATPHPGLGATLGKLVSASRGNPVPEAP